MATKNETQASVELTRFQQQVLSALGEVEKSGEHKYHVPHGLAVKDKLEASEYLGEEVQHGRMYPNLDALADNDLIEKQEVDNRTSGYTVSARGAQYLVKTGSQMVSAAPEVED